MTLEMQLRKRRWILGNPIGSGGFGRVHAVVSDDGQQAAAKLVPKEPGAERELLFVGMEGIRNVVPVIDDGEADGSWVLVMPRAECSLQDYLEARNGVVPLADATTILLDVADALTDMAGKVVHRDIKPGNVLLLDGKWCLADFGISRYAEASTAAVTRKFALSPPWAAPERWRHQRAGDRADVYALGVIAYQLLARKLPFNGPHSHDFQNQHLHEIPARLDDVPPALRALVSGCLSKAPEARPSAADFAARLRRSAAVPITGGLAALANAGAEGVEAAAEAARLQSRERSETDRLTELSRAATESFALIGEELRDTIRPVAAGAMFQEGRHHRWELALQQATLRFGGIEHTAAQPWEGWEPPAFTVVAHGLLSVTFPQDGYGYAGRSHSLWFCDAQKAGEFAWFETTFCHHALTRTRSKVVPFALSPGADAAKALWNGMSTFDVAWPFERLVPGELDGFIDRWSGWLAKAATGRLQHPSTVPERPAQGTWRQK